MGDSDKKDKIDVKRKTPGEENVILTGSLFYASSSVNSSKDN